MKQLVFGAAAIAAIAIAAAAQTRGPAAAGVIHARQAQYKQMGAALKGINDQLRSGTPSIGTIRAGSHLIASNAVQLLRWFPRGTGAEAGVRTRARPEIWSDDAGFRLAGAALLVAARDLEAAARAGNLARIRAAAPQVARACSNCHDSYRAPEQ